MAASVSSAEHDATAHHHPSEFTYIKIAIVLSIITIIEVAIWYIESAGDILVPALIILSAIKFVLVVGYFMHLKFDDRILGWTFGLALVASLAVYLGVWLMHYYDAVVQFVGYLTAG
ncbi:MAG TPA: cytochrome C oxidase subunit IV family protein [Thermomicrobiales bacterium]|nr:cytochrome C oxidase subunit IV family protein [Thermomicrobiales bacterium]